MSGTTTPAYETTWLVPMMQELGLRDARGRAKAVAPTVQPNRPQLPPPPVGKGQSKLPFTGMMRQRTMGVDRRNISQANRDEISAMQDDGLAAEVTLAGNGGRQLKGNFFSAEGHNLKEHASQPDLTRPAVLLLTGSGGSAQDQGLEIAKHYAKSGASVLSVNYGGFGDSSANVVPTEESMHQDAHKMLQHLVDLGYDPEDIVIHGFSLGAAIGGRLKEEMEAGQMTPPDGADATDVRFRGEVLDRPMLSLAHGAKAHGNPGIAQAYARKALGTFSARRAIADSANTDTRIVITNDTDMGDEPGALRQALQDDASHGRRAAVTGTATNADHMNTAKMIETNGGALAALIGTDRTGANQVVASGKPASLYQTSAEMQTAIDNELKSIKQAARLEGMVLSNYSDPATTDPAALGVSIGNVSEALGHALDISRNIPPVYNVFKTAADTCIAQLQKLLRDLTKIRAKLPAPPSSSGGPPPAPAAPPAELVDATSGFAQAALTAWNSAADLALEDKVIEMDDEVEALGRPFFGQQLVDDLANAHDAITQRRDAAARRAAVARNNRRAKVVGGTLFENAV